MTSIDHIDKLLEQSIPKEQLSEVKRILYGSGADTPLEVPQEAKTLAESNNFELRAFKLSNCETEQLRTPRIVRVGVIQHSIVRPTTDPIAEQYKAIEKKLEKMINVAGLCGVNVLCFQEAWTCPFFFCTRERLPWLEFAEDAENGPSVLFVKRMAKQHNMVIVSSILERDSNHREIIANTAVVIGNRGNYIGKHRKVHIPRVGDFNESSYYLEGLDGHPVFATQFGKIAVNICYGRHFPLAWMMYGINGAEIVFNPSATVSGLSEPLWPIEARNAAVANRFVGRGVVSVGCD